MKTFSIVCALLISVPAFAAARSTCSFDFHPVGCKTKNFEKDLAAPQWTYEGLDLDINHDALLDKLVLGVGGSGGQPAMLFLQKPKGTYTYVGEVFGGQYARDSGARRNDFPIFYALSRSGMCNYTLSAISFQKTEYKLLKFVKWECVKDGDESEGVKVVANKGQWKEAKYQIGAKTSLDQLGPPEASEKLNIGPGSSAK